MSDDVE
ncbi:Putative uncharacterized protein [Lacticaseibacillus paracasei]|nr:Putative uncharacterized protein [Lacticaseibacillus paracasei]